MTYIYVVHTLNHTVANDNWGDRSETLCPLIKPQTDLLIEGSEDNHSQSSKLTDGGVENEVTVMLLDCWRGNSESSLEQDASTASDYVHHQFVSDAAERPSPPPARATSKQPITKKVGG
jgi:hypothetical protein